MTLSLTSTPVYQAAQQTETLDLATGIVTTRAADHTTRPPLEPTSRPSTATARPNTASRARPLTAHRPLSATRRTVATDQVPLMRPMTAQSNECES